MQTDETVRILDGKSDESMRFGIDAIDFYTPNRYVDLTDLAHARSVDPNKYLIGIGQRQMAVAPLDQDIVSMGANAAEPLLDDEVRDSLGLLVVGTESGVDQSKASALFIHDLLGLPDAMRVMEIKEACFAGTAALQVALDFVRVHPGRKALVIASDIARYGLGTPGEVTQGAGAVAMVIGADPAILAVEPWSVPMSRSTFDFWRPNYSSVAFADGKYSEKVYVSMFSQVWRRAERSGLADVENLEALLFHIPFSKMGRKGLRSLEGRVDDTAYRRLTRRFEHSIVYGRRVGNIYTGSLYLGLISLLENDEGLAGGQRIGLFSYGSGSEAELYFGTLQPGFREHMHGISHRGMLDGRLRLSVPEYEEEFTRALVEDGSRQVLPCSDAGAAHRLAQVDRHQRLYS